MRLGFVGTGRMGRPMMRKLIEAGHEVRAVGRSAEKAAALAGDGAQVVADPTGCESEFSQDVPPGRLPTVNAHGSGPWRAGS